jgi:AraC family transcriptional regulator
MREQTLTRWETRLRGAIELIGQRMADPPSLAELAAAANVSPFHLHRIWRALLGETVGETLSRLRVELSRDLLQRSGSVTETALAAGFATPQSFARAFRRATGTTPTQALRDELATPLAQVTLERREQKLVITLRREGQTYTNLNATFTELWTWAESAGRPPDFGGIFGLLWDDPVSVPIEALRYDAAMALGDDLVPPSRFGREDLPAAEYASLRHVGSYDDLESATQRLIVQWLLLSGREPADFPIIHQFHDDPDTTPAHALVTDILLPLLAEESNA